MVEINLKLILVGDAGVGKTSLLIKYTEKGFPENYQTTIGVDFRIKTINRKGYKVKIQVIDTAGQERFQAITKSYFKNIDGLLLVFDLTDKESFDNLSSWIERIKSEQDEENNFKVILLGNKCDLKNQITILNNDINDLIINNGIDYPYFETSAKKGTNVMKAFEEMIDLILKDQKEEELLEHYSKKTSLVKLKEKKEKNDNNKKSEKVKCC